MSILLSFSFRSFNLNNSSLISLRLKVNQSTLKLSISKWVGFFLMKLFFRTLCYSFILIILIIAEDKEKEAGSDGIVQKKYPYPKSVFFIISTEFCERFSFYGMKSNPLKKKTILHMDPDREQHYKQ